MNANKAFATKAKIFKKKTIGSSGQGKGQDGSSKVMGRLKLAERRREAKYSRERACNVTIARSLVILLKIVGLRPPTKKK